MSRQGHRQKDIVETLGRVPDFFAAMPDYGLDPAWEDFKTFQLGDTGSSSPREAADRLRRGRRHPLPVLHVLPPQRDEDDGHHRRATRRGGAGGRGHRPLQHLPPRPRGRHGRVQEPDRQDRRAPRAPGGRRARAARSLRAPRRGAHSGRDQTTRRGRRPGPAPLVRGGRGTGTPVRTVDRRGKRAPRRQRERVFADPRRSHNPDFGVAIPRARNRRVRRRASGTGTPTGRDTHTPADGSVARSCSSRSLGSSRRSGGGLGAGRTRRPRTTPPPRASTTHAPDGDDTDRPRRRRRVPPSPPRRCEDDAVGRARSPERSDVGGSPPRGLRQPRSRDSPGQSPGARPVSSIASAEGYHS